MVATRFGMTKKHADQVFTLLTVAAAAAGGRLERWRNPAEGLYTEAHSAASAGYAVGWTCIRVSSGNQPVIMRSDAPDEACFTAVRLTLISDQGSI